MDQELTEFNQKTQTQDSLYDELKKLDQKKKLPSEQEEIERRRQILKGVKTQIDKDELEQKQKQYERKMNDLEDKVSSKEEAQKRKEADRLAEERALQDAKKAKADQSKDFLYNIQAFSIE
jgi:hypothetical protein